MFLAFRLWLVGNGQNILGKCWPRLRFLSDSPNTEHGTHMTFNLSGLYWQHTQDSDLLGEWFTAEGRPTFWPTFSTRFYCRSNTPSLVYKHSLPVCPTVDLCQQGHHYVGKATTGLSKHGLRSKATCLHSDVDISCTKAMNSWLNNRVGLVQACQYTPIQF